MDKLRKWSDHLQEKPQNLAGILFSLAIPFTYLTNILFYYIGLCFEENAARSVLFILFNIVFALICGFFFLYSLRKQKFGIRELLPLGLVLLFFIVAYITSYLQFGLTSFWKNFILQFICIGIPALLAGACGGVWKTERQLLPLLEQISFFLIPATIIYFVGAIFQCNPFGYGANLGIINYMNFSYTLLPFLMALSMRFLEEAEMKLPILGKLYTKSQLMRGGMIALFWLTLMATGCRGPIVCAVAFFLLLPVFSVVQYKCAKRAVLLSAVVLAVLVFNLFIAQLPGMDRLSRMDTFLTGLSQGKLSTTAEDVLSDNEVASIVNQTTETPTQDATQDATQDSSQDSSQETSQETPTEMPVIENRGTLFKLAWQEFLKSPLTGMGVLGYSLKYGGHPHNVLLEILCETGILGTIVLIGILLLATIRILRNSTQAAMMVLFLIPYGIAANISGCVWFSTPLLFALGYGLSSRRVKRIDGERGA